MSTTFRIVMPANQRRIGGKIITDAGWIEWECPECGIIAYTPPHYETLGCHQHGEAPVWMTKSECSPSKTS